MQAYGISSLFWRGIAASVVALLPLKVFADETASSPDRRISIEIDVAGSCCSVVRDGGPVIARSPSGLYRNSSGLVFIQSAPTSWDEPRFLSGEPGRDIVLARRRGDAELIGAMTATKTRSVRAPLSFLPRKEFRATVWEDGATANDVRRSERRVRFCDVLTLKLSPAGGAAVVLEP